jgi:hypothetical protein
MTLYAGLDISMRSVALCIVDQDGRRKRRNGWEAEGDSRARGRRFELLLASGSGGSKRSRPGSFEGGGDLEIDDVGHGGRAVA